MTETFRLRNDPPKKAPWRAENALPARQAKLFVGCDDLPGQSSLFNADGPRLPPEQPAQVAYEIGQRVQYTNQYCQTMQGEIVCVVGNGLLLVQRDCWPSPEAVRPTDYLTFDVIG